MRPMRAAGLTRLDLLFVDGKELRKEPLSTSTTCWQKSSPKRSSFRGDQLRLHEVVESFLKMTPGGTETARGNDSFEQMRIECAEPWSENAAVGLGEQHGDSAAK